MATDAQQILLAALRKPELFLHTTGPFQLLETHISRVLLTGPFAYKFKKPVNLGFVDYSSVEKRHQFCLRELELNRRLAPDLYRQVVAVRGTPEHPHFGTTGEIIEYAVQMRQFPQAALMDRRLADGKVTPEHMDALADQVASFHQTIRRSAADSAFGSLEMILRWTEQNFEQMLPIAPDVSRRAALAGLQNWSELEFALRRTALARRKEDGFIRECHGDLHLGNIVWTETGPLIFDGIEFNDELCWTDTMSEVAFLLMDLEHAGRRTLAFRFLNRYLEQTGDYGGVSVLRYYIVYRALVRAKIALLRLAQLRSPLAEGTGQAILQTHDEYVRLAQDIALRTESGERGATHAPLATPA